VVSECKQLGALLVLSELHLWFRSCTCGFGVAPVVSECKQLGALLVLSELHLWLRYPAECKNTDGCAVLAPLCLDATSREPPLLYLGLQTNASWPHQP
jgi:hypothetical protein